MILHCKAILGCDNLGKWDEFSYESCPCADNHIRKISQLLEALKYFGFNMHLTKLTKSTQFTGKRSCLSLVQIKSNLMHLTNIVHSLKTQHSMMLNAKVNTRQTTANPSHPMCRIGGHFNQAGPVKQLKGPLQTDRPLGIPMSSIPRLN